MEPQGERRDWLDRAGNVTRVYLGVWGLCALSIVAELFVHKHAETGLDGWFGFHGAYGFVACVALVLAAKLMRVLLQRPEDYYERD